MASAGGSSGSRAPGSLRARQVLRFVTDHSSHAALKNVDHNAIKELLSQVADASHFADDSERFEPVPLLEFSNQRSFLKEYKKLQKEIPTLPEIDLKGAPSKPKAPVPKTPPIQEPAQSSSWFGRFNPFATPSPRPRPPPQTPSAQSSRPQTPSVQSSRPQTPSVQSSRPQTPSAQSSPVQTAPTSPVKEVKEEEESSSDLTRELLMQRLKKRLGRRFRESTIDDSWNTPPPRDSTADTTRSTRVTYWPKLINFLSEDGAYWFNELQDVCNQSENNCDLDFVKFYLEYRLRRPKASLTPEQLLKNALDFIDECPQSQADLLTDMYKNDPQLRQTYDHWYQKRISSFKNDITKKKVWSSDPQKARSRMINQVEEGPEGWDKIILEEDPDTEDRNVEARITGSIHTWLDVCLKSINNNNMERHILVKRIDYRKEADRFERCLRGRTLTMKPQRPGSLKDRRKKEIKILYFTCAKDEYKHNWPIAYAVGIDLKEKSENKTLLAWVRTVYTEMPEFEENDINDYRDECGQKRIAPLKRPKKERWQNNKDEEESSGADPDYDTDLEERMARMAI